MRFRSMCISALFLILSPIAVLAQSNATDGALEGFVRDSTAASVPGATVMAVSTTTGQVSEVTANSAGYYRFPLLQVGEYELLVTAPGFAEYRRSGIRLSVGQQGRVDVELGVGGKADDWEVFYEPTLAFALRLLDIDWRDESARST